MTREDPHFDPKETVWLIGDGRSGTTWLSNLINWDHAYRQMFEPFHPEVVDDGGRLLPHQYIRPDDSGESLHDFAADVFSGRLRHPRVDSRTPNTFSDRILVKDIFANLFSCWAARHFPEVKIVLLIRNPLATALSKSKKKGWFWLTDPASLLDQPRLFEDHLRPFEDLIRGVGDDYIERQVLIWCVLHHVPLLQFRRREIHVIFYEDLVVDPAGQLTKLLPALRPGGRELQIELSPELLDRPSWPADQGRIIPKGRPPARTWANELSVRQIDGCRRILRRFGLDGLYGDAAMPDRDVVDHLLAQVSPAATGGPPAAEGVYRLSPDFAVETAEDRVRLTDLRSGQTLTLNPTAALILELMDGRRSTAQIRELLQAAYPEAAADIARDLEGTLGRLLGHGAILP